MEPAGSGPACTLACVSASSILCLVSRSTVHSRERKFPRDRILGFHDLRGPIGRKPTTHQVVVEIAEPLGSNRLSMSDGNNGHTTRNRQQSNGDGRQHASPVP